MEIAAAILKTRFADIYAQAKAAHRAGVSFVQVDICDGVLVPSKTFCPRPRKDSTTKLARLKRLGPLELDLMVQNPADPRWLSCLKRIRPQRIVVHDLGTDFTPLFHMPHTAIGLAVHLDTPFSTVKRMLNTYPFAFVQCMGIRRVGFGGQALDPAAIKRIAAIKRAFPRLPVSVDGGVKLENAAKLKAAGAGTVIVGSGLFGAPDLAERVLAFQKI